MTQIMRERLIRAARECANATHLEKRDWREEDVEEIGGEPIINLAEIVDAILAELREPDAAMGKAAEDAMEGYMDDEWDHLFTAMIDAVRGEPS